MSSSLPCLYLHSPTMRIIAPIKFCIFTYLLNPGIREHILIMANKHITDKNNPTRVLYLWFFFPLFDKTYILIQWNLYVKCEIQELKKKKKLLTFSSCQKIHLCPLYLNHAPTHTKYFYTFFLPGLGYHINKIILHVLSCAWLLFLI